MQLSAILQSIQRVLKPKRLAILEAVAVGLIAAFSALVLKQGVIWLGGWRVRQSMLLPAWILLPGVGLAGGWLAGLLLERAAPEAAGSGIPQVKAALAYLPIALNLRVAVVKLLGTILALSSGLNLGGEGPTVQIGAALAAQLSRWVPASPDHQRQLIAAGAAAGLAASFNAPITGVMFVIEELLQDVSSLTLGTAILASFTGGVVSRMIGGRSLPLGAETFSINFSLAEIPFFLVLGIVVGSLAALFNRSLVASVDYSRRKIRLGLPWKIGLAGLISGASAALLPLAFRDTSILLEFLTTENVSWQMMAGAFVVQFVLTLVACSAETPGGIFIPSLVLGAAIGHLVGLVEFALLGHEPITYALTGMGAFFGAVAKVPITAIVIVFEMTTNFDLVLPLMVSSVTAYLVAERLAPGSLYTHLLRVKGVFLEAEEVKDGLWTRLTAADVMQKSVETLSAQMPLHEAIQAFARSHHRGFPVVENARLIGIVTQSDLDKITPLQLGRSAPLREIMTSQPIAVSAGDSLTQVLYLLSRYKISRLPVVDRRKLIGIITRSDILQVESDKLRGGEEQIGPKPEPSYGVYQTRSPATGRGRILLPLSNPQTASKMLKLALAIAQEQQYEVECLQILLAPRHSSPAEVAVNTTLSRRLLNQAVQQGKRWNVPVHTQIRVTHSVAQAILETVNDRHIDLLLMGWKGSTTTPGRIFGDVVDTAIRQASCDVVLVKLGDADPPVAEVPVPSLSSVQTLLQLTQMNRWLVPIAGGPNSQHAITLLPALVSLSQQPEICLCQVFSPTADTHDTQLLEQDAVFLRQRTPSPITTVSVCANSVSDAVIDMAQQDQCDVIVLGASREGMLQQAIHGNIPEAIARQSRCTVILVRKALV